MFFQLYSVYPCYILNEFRSLAKCEICRRDFEVQSYSNIHIRADKFLHRLQRPNAKGLKNWPLSLSSFNSLLLHEDVVRKLEESHIKGAKFHLVAGIHGKVLDNLPSAPSYYKVEALRAIEFSPSPEEFDMITCDCGIFPRQKIFGEYKEPFKIDKSLLRDIDVFSILPGGFWTCVSKAFVDVLIENQWTQEFRIGSRAFPGMQIKEFGVNWHQETLNNLELLFPDFMFLE
jgi:hypothetical protein